MKIEANEQNKVETGTNDSGKISEHTIPHSPSSPAAPVPSSPAKAPAIAAVPPSLKMAVEAPTYSPQECIKQLLESNFDATSIPAVITMAKYLTNIHNDPILNKYRTINIQNKTFTEKVAPCRGANEFLFSAGFQYDPARESIVMADAHVGYVKPALDALDWAMDQLQVHTLHISAECKMCLWCR